MPSYLLSVFIIVCDHNSTVLDYVYVSCQGSLGLLGEWVKCLLSYYSPDKISYLFRLKAKVIRLVKSCCLPSGCGSDEREMSKYRILVR